MRILTVGNMYPPHHLGGYELIWRSWVRNARARGHEVRVLTSDYRSPDSVDGTEDGEDVHRDLRWYWKDYGWPRQSLRARRAIERANADVIERQLREFRPDAVMWWAMAGMSVSMIERVRRAGVPAVAVLGDYWLEYAPKVDAWARLFNRRPDMVTGVSFVFVSQVLRSGALAAFPQIEEAQVIPHAPPEAELFEPAPPRPWEWKLLYVGRVAHEKGVDLAVGALAELPGAATLTVLGSGQDEYMDQLAAQVRELGMEGRVTFGRRAREELPGAFAAADATLFPVRWGEPFGIVPLEAMAVGRPVVATGRGGSGEYLDDGANCLLFDPDQGAGPLAERIRALAEDPALRERLREGGLRTLDTIKDARFNDAVLETVERAVARGGR